MERKRSGSLKTKILVMLLPIIAVMIAGLAMVSYQVSSGVMEELSQETLESSIKSQKKEIVAWMTENLSVCEALKVSLEKGELSEEQTAEILNGFYDLNSDYVNGAYIGEESGKLYKAQQSAKTESDVCHSQWYQEGLTRVNMEYGDAYVNSDGQSVISATGMINDGKEMLRVLSVDVTLDRIRIIVNSNVEMKDAEAFLVDTADDTILSHRSSSLVGTSLNDAKSDALLQSVSEKLKKGDLETELMEGYQVAFQKIDNTSWVLVSYVPLASVLEEVYMLRNLMLAIGAFCIIVLLIVIERIIHLSIRPIRGLTDVITTMSTGDFTVEVTEKGNNEISVMSHSVKEFMDSMKEMIRRIVGISKKLEEQAISSNQAAEEMQMASKRQEDSMQGLNETVDNLVSSVNEIAESATTLACVVAETRENGREVAAKMEDTVSVTEKGRLDMEEVRNAMQVISASIENLEEAVGKVGRASDEITKIVTVIGEIAEETNLLSLNASIEAARAGEAGKGFAVVADEIGKLAGNSADSAQNIAKLIEGIRTLVNDCVMQSDVSADQIRNSSELIDTALYTFRQIYGNIGETSELINSVMEKIAEVDDVATTVAAVSEEQAASATMIQETSENMVAKAQSILANSNKVADDSRQLAESAMELDTNMKIFRIGEGGCGHEK